nr:reverse transcriptase domain-containing protein [Tanacetum cinerariifolium]
MAYSVGSSEKKEYAETLPLCNKCKLHHNGSCTVKSDCPELKNQNHGNQVRGTEARKMVYSLGGGETNQDLNNMEDDINA